MAQATEAELQASWGHIVLCFHNLMKALVSNTPNWIDNQRTYEQALVTDYGPEAMDSIRATRGELGNALSRFPDCFGPILREYGRIMGAPEVDPRTLAFRLYQWFVDTSQTVLSRNITYDNPAFVGQIGNGVINRLTVDRYGFPIEAVFLDTKTAECFSDQTTGTKRHQEAFALTGASPSRDGLLPTGYTGNPVGVNALAANDGGLISNPSFSVGTSGSDVTDWTVTTVANTAMDTANYYRDFPGDTTPASLKLSTSVNSLSQRLSVLGRALNPNVPIYAQLAWNVEVYSGTGRIEIKLGSVASYVDTASATGWNILRLELGANNWYDNFKEDNLALTINYTGWASGSVLIDDVIVAPMTPFDNTYFAFVGGSTPWMTRDKATWTDALVGTDSILQYWMWRFGNLYLPHTSVGPIVADPS